MNQEDKSCKTPRWRLLKAQLNNLGPAAFREKMNTEPEAVLIDVRTPGEFALHALPGAININYLGENFLEELNQLDTEKTHLVYCRTGRRSIRVCTLMRNGGFDPDRVYNLDGGIADWDQ